MKTCNTSHEKHRDDCYVCLFIYTHLEEKEKKKWNVNNDRIHDASKTWNELITKITNPMKLCDTNSEYRGAIKKLSRRNVLHTMLIRSRWIRSGFSFSIYWKNSVAYHEVPISYFFINQCTYVDSVEMLTVEHIYHWRIVSWIYQLHQRDEHPFFHQWSMLLATLMLLALLDNRQHQIRQRFPFLELSSSGVTRAAPVEAKPFHRIFSNVFPKFSCNDLNEMRIVA